MLAEPPHISCRYSSHPHCHASTTTKPSSSCVRIRPSSSTRAADTLPRRPVSRSAYWVPRHAASLFGDCDGRASPAPNSINDWRSGRSSKAKISANCHAVSSNGLDIALYKNAQFTGLGIISSVTTRAIAQVKGMLELQIDDDVAVTGYMKSIGDCEGGARPPQTAAVVGLIAWALGAPKAKPFGPAAIGIGQKSLCFFLALMPLGTVSVASRRIYSAENGPTAHEASIVH